MAKKKKKEKEMKSVRTIFQNLTTPFHYQVAYAIAFEFMFKFVDQEFSYHIGVQHLARQRSGRHGNETEFTEEEIREKFQEINYLIKICKMPTSN